MSALETYWNVVPYAVLAIFVVGVGWRYRYDQFGWTTRSSQLYESKLLQIASPLFHFGIVAVALGHVMGLVIPESWTDAVGVDEHLYHLVAVSGGAVAGVATLVGFVLLIYRRLRTESVRRATSTSDKITYVVLLAVIVAGLSTTVLGANGGQGNYRESVSPWFRSIWIFQPDGAAMADAGASYQVHVTIALVLFALIPFSRLVHMFSVPFQYLFRPYVVYRSRDKVRAGKLLGSEPQRKGWS